MNQGKAENALRKLHSLSGVIPLGVFLMVHMLVNYSATGGEEAYNFAAGIMANLPFRYFLETFVIFVPLLFHAVYGVYVALKAKQNVLKYGYFRNWGFFFQRVTGFIAFAFVIWHIWDTRVQAALGAEPNFEMMAALVTDPLTLGLYLVGVVCVLFHFANGLWTLLITWGITVTPKSQKFTQYALMLFFIGFSALGVQALFAFAQ
ncbi:MAG TPA: succinate dehydrogenase [Coriobacteriia bacterium]|nr:succinate dehydrogenase [Coriobacteriia bacterium]